MTRSKIIKVDKVKEWSSETGTKYYYHNLEMENGDRINIPFFEKKEEGNVIDYKITGSGQTFNKAIVGNGVKQNNTSGLRIDILYQVSLKGAMDFYIANDSPGVIDSHRFTPSNVCSMAKEITEQAIKDINGLK